ncbi:MAG: tRNA pseudouridine(55) synthase TruB [Flavobacteriales bacterium]
MTFDPKQDGEVFLVDKPKDWTSFDVVAHLRTLLKKRHRLKRLKVGHAGTLDPMATGLLICCSGRQTKRIQEFQEAEKEYVATLQLGYRTFTCDAESELIAEHSTKEVTDERIEQLLPSFQGTIQQVPPSHSAVRVNGKRAYEEARKGRDPGLGARTVKIHDIRVEASEIPELTLRIRCGKGSYIRSIARDLGDRLGCGAYLSALRRTRIGDHLVEDARTIHELRASLRKDIDPEHGK